MINIGWEVYNKTLGKYRSNIGAMPLNCLIFQDDIAKINAYMNQVREGAREIGGEITSDLYRDENWTLNFILIKHIC